MEFDFKWSGGSWQISTMCSRAELRYRKVWLYELVLHWICILQYTIHISRFKSFSVDWDRF